VTFKNILLTEENGIYSLDLDKNDFIFSYRINPLHYYMSLCKQLGAFAIGVDFFFDSIENSFKEKVLEEIYKKLKNT